MDLDAGYWQVKLAESSREKTAFFTPEGKKHWLVMPMGILNAHAFFVCMTTNFKQEWHELYKSNPKLALQKLFAIVERHKKAIEDLTGKETTRNLEHGLAKALAETDPGSSVIVDDVMVFDTNILSLVAYFVTVLEILVKYRVTVNFRKTRFLPPRAEFVGTGSIQVRNHQKTLRPSQLRGHPDAQRSLRILLPMDPTPGDPDPKVERVRQRAQAGTWRKH